MVLVSTVMEVNHREKIRLALRLASQTLIFYLVESGEPVGYSFATSR